MPAKKKKKPNRNQRRRAAEKNVGIGKRGVSSDAADLRFGPSESMQGFTSAGLASYNDINPNAVVRELIQNAIDAVADAPGTDVAKVRFVLTKCRLDETPGIGSYRRAFDHAIKTQSAHMSDQAGQIVNHLKETLGKSEVDVLAVLDNGVGLDAKRMNALLSDGVSLKSAGSAGTYGNGHMTAIPASDLRYALYGGVTATGHRLASGHAVLASHHDGQSKRLASGDGHYIVSFDATQSQPYRCPTNDAVPSLVSQFLDEIQTDFGHGSAVILPTFNHFRDEATTLWDNVAQAAGSNFFVAIESGGLTVEVHDRRDETAPMFLDKAKLAETLAQYKENKRAKRGFLNGERAFQAHEAYRDGEQYSDDVLGGDLTAGQVDVRLLYRDDGPKRIDFCRNGMWITDKAPRFQNKFADKRPFHAIISLNPKSGGTIYDLVRRAEGPLHNDLLLARIVDRAQRTELFRALGALADWLEKHVDKVSTDSFGVAGIFDEIDFGGESSGSSGRAQRSLRGTPVLLGRRRTSRQIEKVEPGPAQGREIDPANEGRGKRPPNAHRPRARPTLRDTFMAAARPAGPSRQRIELSVVRDCADAELRLIVDEALDATCERHGMDEYLPARLPNATLNGEPLDADRFTTWGKDRVGIRLGDLKNGATLAIETDYELAADFSSLVEPSLRVELFTRETADTATTSPSNSGDDDA